MLKSAICVLEQYKHIPAHTSGECAMDVGGYFIINGSEKTCLAQEERRKIVYSVLTLKTTVSGLESWDQICTWYEMHFAQADLDVRATKNNGFGTVFIQVPRIKNPIPLFVLFRALGIISDKEICRHIVLDVDEEKWEVAVCSSRFCCRAQKYIDQESAIKLIVNSAMFTPLNMDKATGDERNMNLLLMY